MRIIAGRFKGRALKGPTSDAIRPTSDRLRETLFNVLMHRFEGLFDGTRVMDLFAGTGALGLEAMSRGARHCLFVDASAEARGIIRANVEALGLTGATRIFRRDAASLGPRGTDQLFDLAFLDPPYRKGLGEQALAGLEAGGWLKAGAIVVLEEAADAGVALPDGYQELDRREAGEGKVLILRAG